jgi:hypothetical protein
MADEKHPRRDQSAEERDEVIDATDATDDSTPIRPNPPRTTAGGWTSPKFGSAGSGGAELEPGPERD